MNASKLVLVGLLSLPAFASAAVFTVSNTSDSGPGSLRQAIVDANANPGPDTITFAIGTGVKTILPTSPLPAVTNAVTIDGTAQPGYAGYPVIEISGSSAGIGTVGLNLQAGSSTVRGLAINRFSGSGIVLQTGGGNWIAGNFIGTDVTGTLKYGNGDCGIAIYSSSGNHIGGTNSTDHNLVSGNVNDGILLSGYSDGNRVEGNIIGLNSAGTVKIGNSGHGIRCITSSDNQIGGASAASRNLCSASAGAGIRLESNSNRNLIQGNFLGTDVTGTKDLGNNGNGIYMNDSHNNTVGGTAVGAGNLVSGNTGQGIGIDKSTGNLVQGNLVGTDISGAKPLGNHERGVSITGGASGYNIVGGVQAGARNVISANGTTGSPAAGIGIENDYNRIQGNFIGTDITGTAALGNKAYGVTIRISGDSNVIGGAGFGEGNVIAFNAQGGIQLLTGKANCFSANSIHANGGLGVNLNNDEVTPNDSLDSDGGPNYLQNYPGLTSAVNVAGGIRVSGTLNTAPNSPEVIIEFFGNAIIHPTGYGEGEVYLGRSMVATDGAGNANFDLVLPAPCATIGYVAATATLAGSTSEFSACVAVTGLPRLAIRRLGGNRVALEWPANSVGFQLESASSLGSGFWTTNFPVMSASTANNLNVVVVECTGPNRSFRLKKF